LVEEGKQEKLRKGNVARRKFLAEMQHKAALHFEHDMGKTLCIRTNLIGWISCKRDGSSGIQRALKLKAPCGLSTSLGEEIR
jgi:hypothetical protein